MPLLHAHADTVTDMDFSPFHDGLLATGSQDCLVNISKFYLSCFFSNRQIILLLFIKLGKIMAYSGRRLGRIPM